MKVRLFLICISVLLIPACLGGCFYSEEPGQLPGTTLFIDDINSNLTKNLTKSLTPENVASAPKVADPFSIEFRIWRVLLDEGEKDYLVCNVGIYNISDNPLKDVYVEVFYHESIREYMLTPEIKSVKSNLNGSGSKGNGAILTSGNLFFKQDFMTQYDAKLFEDEWDHVTLVIHYNGEEMEIEMTRDDIFWTDE